MFHTWWCWTWHFFYWERESRQITRRLLMAQNILLFLVAFPKGVKPLLPFRSMKKPKATLVATWIASPGMAGISRACCDATCCSENWRAVCRAGCKATPPSTNRWQKGEESRPNRWGKKTSFPFSEEKSVAWWARTLRKQRRRRNQRPYVEATVIYRVLSDSRAGPRNQVEARRKTHKCKQVYKYVDHLCTVSNSPSPF